MRSQEEASFASVEFRMLLGEHSEIALLRLLFSACFAFALQPPKLVSRAAASWKGDTMYSPSASTRTFLQAKAREEICQAEANFEEVRMYASWSSKFFRCFIFYS